MKVRADQDALAGALARVRQASIKSTIEILESIKLQASGTQLLLSATNMDLLLQEAVDCDVVDPGGACVTADKLSAFISALPKSSMVDLSAKGGRLRIASGVAHANLRSWNPDDFPAFTFESKGAADPVTIDAAELARLIAMTLPCASRGESSRQYIECVFLRGDENSITAVATDGNRMTVGQSEVKAAFQGISIPSVACELIAKLCPATKDGVGVEIAGDKLRFSMGRLTLISKLLSQSFIEWERVLADSVKTPAIFDAEAMRAVIRRVVAVSDADAGKLRPRGMRLLLHSTKISIESGATQNPDLVDEIEAEYAGPEITIGLMSRYLADAIAALGGEGEIELHASAPDRPVRLCRKGRPEESVTLMVYRA
jgi:DNA polymerase-3 subunit beta